LLESYDKEDPKVTEFCQLLGPMILRPRVENLVTAHDKHPARLIRDLLGNHIDVFASTPRDSTLRRSSVTSNGNKGGKGAGLAPLAVGNSLSLGSIDAEDGEDEDLDTEEEEELEELMRVQSPGVAVESIVGNRRSIADLRLSAAMDAAGSPGAAAAGSPRSSPMGVRKSVSSLRKEGGSGLDAFFQRRSVSDMRAKAAEQAAADAAAVEAAAVAAIKVPMLESPPATFVIESLELPVVGDMAKISDGITTELLIDTASEDVRTARTEGGPPSEGFDSLMDDVDKLLAGESV
ncbi:hypothetical protein HK101_004870, partial [Irineochytrium annulatum]